MPFINAVTVVELPYENLLYLRRIETHDLNLRTSIYTGQKNNGSRFFGVMNLGSNQELIVKFLLLENLAKNLMKRVLLTAFNDHQVGCIRVVFIQIFQVLQSSGKKTGVQSTNNLTVIV